MAVGIRPELKDPVVVVAGVPTPLGLKIDAVQSMMLQAASANTGSVWLGDATVEAGVRGLELVPGEKIGIDSLRRSTSFDSFYLSEWFVDGTDGDTVQIIILDYRG
jgi:hypothetical protein